MAFRKRWDTSVNLFLIYEWIIILMVGIWRFIEGLG